MIEDAFVISIMIVKYCAERQNPLGGTYFCTMWVEPLP